jgi:hypothetical protein
MFKVAFDLVLKVYGMVALAVTQIEILLAGKTGPEKKQAALDLLAGWLKQYLPGWVVKIVTGILGSLVDQAVAHANSESIFTHAADPPPPPIV